MLRSVQIRVNRFGRLKRASLDLASFPVTHHPMSGLLLRSGRDFYLFT